jgi:Tol biopolymer transport system component
LSKPFFTIVAYHLRQFARGGAGQERGRGFAARRIHPHVERAIGAKREATLRIVDLSAGTDGRLTPSDHFFFGSAWTPDDTRIVSNTVEDGKRVIASIDTRSGTRRVVYAEDIWQVPTSVAPDGTLFMDTLISGRLNDIVYLSHGVGTETRAYLATPASEAGAAVSPDGRVVAYTSDTSGRQELYLDSFPEHGEARRVSTDGATGAYWRADGRELYFVVGLTLMACDVKTSPSIEAGKPHLLFELPKDMRGAVPAPDGDKFFLLKAVGESPSSLTLVQNWAAQLEKHE